MMMTCSRPACRRPGAAIYSAPQYPAAWRGPLCDRHAVRLHEKMQELRDEARADVVACPSCNGILCDRHAAQLRAIGAVPPSGFGQDMRVSWVSP